MVPQPRLRAGTLTGYGTKTLPGVREAIEQERFDDAVRYITLTAGVLNAYSDRLDQASALLRETQQAAASRAADQTSTQFAPCAH